MPAPDIRMAARISPEQKAAVDEATRSLGINFSTLQRLAIDALLAYIAKNSGNLTLPVTMVAANSLPKESAAK